MIALCLFGLTLAQTRVARGSITLGIIAGVASGLTLFGGGLWWYNSSVDKAQKQLIEDSKLLYTKYSRLYAAELRIFKDCKDTPMLAATLPNGAFNVYVTELSKNRATVQTALVSLHGIISSKKIGDTLSRQAQEQIQYLSVLAGQLENFAHFLDVHYGYFELYKKHQTLAWHYAKEMEIITRYGQNDPDRVSKQVKATLLSSCSDSSIAYPYVTYSNGVHDDLRALDSALESFTRTEGQTVDGTAGTLYKNSMSLRYALETIKNVVAQTREYQAQRELYQQALRAQALVEAEQRKALAEEQKNAIEMQKLEELRRANSLQQQSIYEQQRQARALKETKQLLNQSLVSVNDHNAKQQLKHIQKKLNNL